MNRFARHRPPRCSRLADLALALALLIGAAGCEVEEVGADAALVPDAALPLTLVVQPQDQLVTTGSTATFWVEAAAPAPISYQWTVNGSTIVGATAAQYTTPRTTAADADALFAVIVTSGDLTIRSDSAQLAIDTSIDDLIALAGGSTWSNSTPMGTHYQDLHVTSDEDRAYLADPVNGPPVPHGLSGSLSWREFPVTLYPSGSPRPADVNQHALGDCNGISALADLAYQNPDFVMGLIDDQGDGVFNIAMFDPQGLPVTVAVDSLFLADAAGELAAASGKNGEADWGTVLEKAIMKYNVVYQANSTIEGIGSEHVTPLFTGAGNSFGFSRGSLAPEQITRLVEVSLACGKLITGGFGEPLVLGRVHAVVLHGYACFWPSNDATMITMRNPWGANPRLLGGYDASRDGLLDIPISATWAHTIDIRVIDPGRAGTMGRTTPYVPLWAHTFMSPIRIAPRIAHGWPEK